MIWMMANLNTACVLDHPITLRTWSCSGVLYHKILIFRKRTAIPSEDRDRLSQDQYNRYRDINKRASPSSGCNTGWKSHALEPASPIISLLGVALNQRWSQNTDDKQQNRMGEDRIHSLDLIHHIQAESMWWSSAYRTDHPHHHCSLSHWWIPIQEQRSEYRRSPEGSRCCRRRLQTLQRCC